MPSTKGWGPNIEQNTKCLFSQNLRPSRGKTVRDSGLRPVMFSHVVPEGLEANNEHAVSTFSIPGKALDAPGISFNPYDHLICRYGNRLRRRPKITHLVSGRARI